MANRTQRAKSRRSSWRWTILAPLIVVLVSASAGAGVGFFMRRELPEVRALEDYDPPLMTTVLSSDGSELDTFAEQRRILIAFADVPEQFIQGLVATEDTDFYRHTGIDFKGIARAAWLDIKKRELAQGASTLTQQLARNLFLHRDKTIRRKAQEALLALEIEQQYSKQEILRFYCNQIYFGHGRYGLEAASRHYFSKPARELDLTESATLAGIIQRPEGLSPIRHPERALDRRNHVLRRMAEVGYLTPEESEAAQAMPLTLGSTARDGKLAPYFVEEIRRWLQETFGSSSLYTEGLRVNSTLDPTLQELANRAVDTGLRELDKRQGWRGTSGRIPEGEDPASWSPDSWKTDDWIGRIHDGVVTDVEKKRIGIRVGPYSGKLEIGDMRWTDHKDARKIADVGDLLRVRIAEASEATAKLELEQEPQAQAAIVVIDPQTGAVRAMVGGFDFESSEFNRAIQAKRQTGSSFKPFVYTAALASGWTLADTVVDEPTVFLDPRKPEPYQPENYSKRYLGTVTLRSALERSANIATVKLLDAVGYDDIIHTAQGLGIGQNLRPFASIALGAFETSLIELTSAYGAFANQGVLVEPHFVDEVRDHEGALIQRIEPAVRDAVSPEVAYLMNSLLRGVISDGTGRAAKSLGPHLAGKTGTTDDFSDAWFIGYSPHLAVGVWVGFDEPRTLGKKESGAKAALPIWRAFMAEALKLFPQRDFPMPPGVITVSIDRRTGLKASRSAYCRNVVSEVFIEGTEPTEYCSVHHHQQIRLPYAFHRFPLNEDGALRISAPELERLLEREPNVRLTRGARRIEAYLPQETIGMEIEIVAGRPLLDPEEDPRLEAFDVAEWVGTDGRAAEIVWIDGRRGSGKPR